MKKVALLILDGWGHGDKIGNAIKNAKTPIDSLYKKYNSDYSHTENT